MSVYEEISRLYVLDHHNISKDNLLDTIVFTRLIRVLLDVSHLSPYVSEYPLELDSMFEEEVIMLSQVHR